MNLLSIFLIAAKRLWNNKGLTLCSIIGLVTAVALISSVPLYTDAANFKVLKEKLSQNSEDATQRRPPFAFMYRYIGAWHGAVDIEDFDPVDAYATRSVPGVIGLPAESLVRHVKTDNFSLFPLSDVAYIGLRQPLGWVNVGFVSDLTEHIQIVDGAFPAQTPGDDALEVMVSQDFAVETGLQVGEEYVLFRRPERASAESDATAVESRPIQIQMRIAGIWIAQDATEPYWFYNPRALANTLMISEESFRARIAPAMTDEVYAAIWYIIFDGERVRTDDVPGLLGRINYANTRVGTLLPNTVLEVSPSEALENYRWTTFIMTIILYVFAIPILLLVLYFIGMISGLVVERQRGEIAILKSRGAGDMQVIGIYALEGAIIGIIGLVLGTYIGRYLAIAMGNTVSFLAFGARQPLPVILTQRAIRMALIGVAIALIASLGPALRAARLTIVTYKRERARAMERPFWQRYFLDVLLLIPSGYGYYILQNRGTINFLGEGAAGDPFSNPLLFLVPALSIFAVSLLVIRVFPLVMEFLAWLTSQFSGIVSIVLAMRQLARVSKQYTGALLLLILTLSLATFTASMARTLDQSLIDRMYYQNGSDYFLVESGENPELTAGSGGPGGISEETAPSSDAESQAIEQGGWVFIPVAEHLKVPGVTGATRVGTYPARAVIGKNTAQGRFFGIDRLDFPNVGFFREDFAYRQLGSLMNRLALDSSALLVSPNFLADYSLNVGDRVDLDVSTWGQRGTISFIIADVMRYFPTYYPDNEENRYLFVGNLDYVFEMMGGLFPYDVWISTDGEVDPKEMQAMMSEQDIRIVSMRGSREAIRAEQERPERTGMFGILSVGFVAAAILTVLGFLLHSFIAFRRRFIEFGVLRAIGLSVGQMIGFLGVEQILLIATGITAGTGIGIWVSRLFIPFLQVGTARNINVPPFAVLIAWDDIVKIYGVFGVMLLLAVAGMIWFLIRLRIFEAVKLGEAV
ncbi:MAG: ABC transporter permease [Anaerolineae bacterium]